MVVILSAMVSQDNSLIREQIIGEARAYKTCAEYAESTHKQLVKIKERKQKENERPKNHDIF